MLKVPLYRWFLLVCGLVVAGVVVAAASVLLNRDPATWQVASVEVSGHAAGGVRLALAGEGLPGNLRAMLVPEASSAGTNRDGADLAIPLYQLATDGRVAVATTRDQRLLALDVTESDSPKVLGSFNFPAQWQAPDERGISALELVGSRVIVAKGKAGLTLIDLSTPQSPRQVDSLELRTRLFDLQANGNIAYLASDEFGLMVVTWAGDRLASRPVPGTPPTFRLAVERQRLVTVGPKGELACYRLDAQGQPELLGTLAVEEDVRDLVLTPEALYLGTSNGQLLTFTLDDWPRPRLAGRIAFKGRPLKLEWMPGARTLLCSLVGSGIAVIDVSRAAAPRLTGVLPMAKVPLSIKIQADRAFLAGMSGLKILSDWEILRISPPSEIDYSLLLNEGRPSLLRWNSAIFAYNRTHLKQLAAGTSEVLKENATTVEPAPFLFLPDEQGVRLLAIHDGMPTDKVLERIPIYDGRGAGDPPEGDVLVKKVLWRDGRVFVLSPEKIFIFGVDGSGRITSTQEFQTADITIDMAWLAPGYLVVAVHNRGLQIVDVGRPGTPRIVGEYPLPKHQRSVGALKSLLVDGNRLYVARARLGVEIYDLTDPASPRLLQRIDTPGFAGSLDLNQGLLLVADSDQGVFVIDVSGRQAVAVGSYHLPTRPREVLYDGAGLFVTNASGGILRFPPPLRFAKVDTAFGRRASLTIPAGVVPGRYQLALYDDKTAVNLPVTLQ